MFSLGGEGAVYPNTYTCKLLLTGKPFWIFYPPSVSLFNQSLCSSSKEKLKSGLLSADFSDQPWPRACPLPHDLSLHLTVSSKQALDDTPCLLFSTVFLPGPLCPLLSSACPWLCLSARYITCTYGTLHSSAFHGK